MCRNIFLLFFLFFFQASSAQKGERPNIIYIMADDLGYADLSCFGRKDYRTPNLDKLCSQGVKFTNAYAAAPVCTPTRVAFLTGRYPARLTVGLYEPIAEDSLAGLSPETPSVAYWLKESGYETYLVGKWHLGFRPEHAPNKNGFDYFFGFKTGATDYISHTAFKGEPDLYENDILIQRQGYITDILGEKAIDIIRQPHQKPFFLALMFNAPHWPWQAPGDKPVPYGDAREWSKGGSARVYAAMMKSLDDAVGNVVKAIDDLKLSTNTVIIFTSDNGGERLSDNGIYKGGKMQLWEGGIREPAFIRWAGKFKENSITDQVVTTMDWTATILSIAGAKADKNFPLDGIDLMPLLTGKQRVVQRTLYWRIFQRNQHKAIRDGKWKWLQDEKGVEYLFDLVNDPSEKNNLKQNHPSILLQLKNKFSEWEKTMLAPLPL
ncbi:MAG TPA: sulfatase-like hydrolase/transferase [Chitinophagaceae bacterium]|nr:sulfatase-like hydrolase/transferase [Chitinophagaceae bacterium]